MTAPPLDLDWVRARFPGLRDGEVLMDNAGGAQVPDTVIERIGDYLTNSNVQLGASYTRSQRASEAVAAARSALGTLLNAPHPDELVIGPSTTELLARLARGMVPSLQEGDEIVITEAEHESNAGPWARLSAHGVTIRTWPVQRDPVRLDLADLDALLNTRTRLVCVTHCSNILGSETPIAAKSPNASTRRVPSCVWTASAGPRTACPI
jgi:selenocysteine lyase/cysteine desulfurase